MTTAEHLRRVAKASVKATVARREFVRAVRAATEHASLAEIARAAGMSKSGVYKIVRGEK